MSSPAAPTASTLSTTSEDGKELIVFVPGMGADEPEAYLERLTGGFRDFCANRGLALSSQQDNAEAGANRRRIEIDLPGGGRRTLDIVEAFWGDLKPRLSSQSLLRRIGRGLVMLIYWLASLRSWQAAASSRYLLFNVLFTVTILLLWYFGALIAGLTAVGSDPSFFGATLPESLQPLAGRLGGLGRSLGGWSVWAAASLVLAALPATAIVDIAFASMAYLQNRHGMRGKIGGRVARALAEAVRGGEGYQRISVVAHSFGVVIATEVLADYRGTDRPPLRFVSLGGPLLLVAARERRVAEARDRLIANAAVAHWVDFHSEQDWLCTRSPVPAGTAKFEDRPLTSTVAWDERLSGASHHLYFEDPEVLASLLFAPPEAA